MSGAMASGSSSDKTVNKVALCSAIFAGFAYVGYSVVRTAFHRRRREGDVSYPEGEARLYFRRLSQTTQTDALLGQMDLSGGGRIILRPLSVQERIRELNYRARHFADTMLALQSGAFTGSVTLKGPAQVGARSLQASPWSSPRILSPVDVRHFIASRSSDNLSIVPVEGSSPVRRRWSRKAVGRKGGAVDDSSAQIADISEDLKDKLESLSLKGRAMDSLEAKTLVALLFAADESLLERALITLANLATLESNQASLREAGALPRLHSLLTHPKPNLRLAAIRAMGNMALAEQNQRELKNSVPVLLSYAGGEEEELGVPEPSHSLAKEEAAEAALTTLANLALLVDGHEEFWLALHGLLGLVDGPSLALQVQALKLLVNLSTNEEMVPRLLAAQAPKRLLYLLEPTEESQVLVRLLTLLGNIAGVAKKGGLTPSCLPLEDKAPSPDTLYAALFGLSGKEAVGRKTTALLTLHPDEEVRVQARRLSAALTSSTTST